MPDSPVHAGTALHASALAALCYSWTEELKRVHPEEVGDLIQIVELPGSLSA